MTTAHHRPLVGGSGGESAWKAGASGTAWRGGGAAEPLWAALATPPPAARRLRADPASSPSAAREGKTRARGEGRGGAVLRRRIVLSFAEVCD